MRQEPEQVLPQERAAAAADMREVAANRQAGRQEEAGVRHLVHQLHDGGGFQRRKGQQQQEGRDELRPDEERQAHPGHARRAQLNDRGDEVDRAQQRRGDEEHHANDPERLPVGRNRRRQRRIGGPARLRGAAGDEEAGEHDQPADHIGLVAGHVHAREGHVRRADLQRHDVIAERGKGQRHDAHEDHDGPVHRAEGVVKVRRHDPLGRHVPEDRRQQRAHHRHRLARVGDLPAHHHHQAESEQEEEQRGDAILNADDLVVGGEDVRAPEARLLVVRFVNSRHAGLPAAVACIFISPYRAPSPPTATGDIPARRKRAAARARPSARGKTGRRTPQKPARGSTRPPGKWGRSN